MEPLVLLAITLMALAAGCLLVRARARVREMQGLPRGLRGARLMYAEQTFRVRQPVTLVARVDRGYELRGKLYLAEFKTRKFNRVYRSDIVELSAQRMAIEGSTEQTVSRTAYVVIVDSAGMTRAVQQVRLMEREELMTLIRRRQAILEGWLMPHYAKSDALCRKCGFKKECRPDL